MSNTETARRITAITAAAELGGTERVLLDFAVHAFEYGIALRVLTPRHGPLIDLLNNLGVPADAVPAPGTLLRASQRPGHLTSIPPALLGLRRWARQIAAHEWYRDAEVVYSVAFKGHLAAALTRKHPVVWHLHEYPPARTGRFWRSLARRLPDALIANSHAVGDAWTSGRGHLAPQITVIPNGVDLDRFEPRMPSHWVHNELGIPWEVRLIGMPAVFARWKGQLEVIDAFEALGEEFPNVHLVFVGGSIYDTVAEREYGETLLKRISQSPSQPRIHLLPFQHRIEHVYPEFDLTLHYSTRPEPFGRVVIEAMACAVPVIAAAEGGPLEILGGGIGPRREAGWLAEARDPEALARILRSALNLPTDVLRSIGAAGRRRAEDLFSARAFAKGIADALLSMTKAGNREKGKGKS